MTYGPHQLWKSYKPKSCRFQVCQVLFKVILSTIESITIANTKEATGTIIYGYMKELT